MFKVYINHEQSVRTGSCIGICQNSGSGSHGRAVKSAVSESLDHLTAVTGVGSSPAMATCETSQVLLAGVPGVFFLGVLPFLPTY